MGQPPRELTPEASPAHFFGAELRRWRTRRGLSQQQLANHVFASSSLIGKIEKAERQCARELAHRCDTVLETGGHLEELFVLTQAAEADSRSYGPDAALWSARSVSWCATFAEATALLFEMGSMDLARRSLLKLVPVATVSTLPLQREWLLSILNSGPTHVVPHDDDAIARARRMIRELDELDNRHGGGHARSIAVQYMIYELLPQLSQCRPEKRRRELATLAAKLCAMTGWMSYDADGLGLAQRYMIQALQLCREGGDRVLAGQIFAGLSHLATATGNPAEGLQLAEVGLATAKRAGSPLGLMRICAMAARADAALGNSPTSAMYLNDAERAFDASRGPASESEWVRFIDQAYLEGETAQCLPPSANTSGLPVSQNTQSAAVKARGGAKR